MALVKEPVTPSLIPNTTMVKGVLNGVHKSYEITPIDGYVLHDRLLDEFAEYDENGNGIGEPIVLGFYSGTRSVAASYDFTANPREFYAILRTTVPEGSHIAGLDDPDTEVM